MGWAYHKYTTISSKLLSCQPLGQQLKGFFILVWISIIIWLDLKCVPHSRQIIWNAKQKVILFWVSKKHVPVWIWTPSSLWRVLRLEKERDTWTKKVSTSFLMPVLIPPRTHFAAAPPFSKVISPALLHHLFPPLLSKWVWELFIDTAAAHYFCSLPRLVEIFQVDNVSEDSIMWYYDI